MEQIDHRKKVLTLVVVILLLLLVIAIGFIVYDKVIRNDDSQTSIIQSSVNNNDYNYKLSDRKKVRYARITMCEVGIELLSDLKGNVYLQPLENFDKICDSTDNEKNRMLRENTVENRIVGHPQTSSIDAIKIDISNVLIMYTVGYNFVFIHEDGTMSYLNFDEIINTGKINIKKIDGITNAVSVAGNGFGDSYVITRNGNEIELNNYLK